MTRFTTCLCGEPYCRDSRPSPSEREYLSRLVALMEPPYGYGVPFIKLGRPTPRPKIGIGILPK